MSLAFQISITCLLAAAGCAGWHVLSGVLGRRRRQRRITGLYAVEPAAAGKLRELDDAG